MLSSRQAPPDIFLCRVGIIFAQTSLDSYRASRFSPCLEPFHDMCPISKTGAI
jgi:hypothetical protein